MRRASLYSTSSRSRTGKTPPRQDAGAQPHSQPPSSTPALPPSTPTDPAPPAGRRARLHDFFRRHNALFSLIAGALISLGIVYGYGFLHPAPRPLAQEEIDSAVMPTLQTESLPSQAG